MVLQFESTDPLKEKDSLTREQRELKKLHKINKQLLVMENDILKQAALIFAQKSK